MPKNLLVADDSITIQKVVSITFAGEDFRITAVDNGDDALARSRELKPDIILADVVMPRKNGYEVCEAVKADPALRHIPVLLLAGTFEAFDEVRARAVHADAHIAKPFESQALLTKVKELLDRPAQPAAPAAAPATKPVAPPPGVAVAAPRPAPSRPPPGGPPPGRPPMAAPPGTRPLAQAAVSARPPGAPPVARPMGAPPAARLPPAGPPPGAPPRASAPPPPAGPPPSVRPAPTMPAPPPVASPPAAARARNPFGLDDAPAAPAAPPVAAHREHLDLDWGELEGSGAPSQPAPPTPAPSVEAAPIANARVLELEELEELDFESVVEAPEPAPAAQTIDLPEMGLDEELELAPATEFIPQAASTGHAPESAATAMELDLEPLAPAPAAAAPSVASAPTARAGDGGEALLRQALSQASREVIERIAWEVVPELAETIIREQLDRLVKERQR